MLKKKKQFSPDSHKILLRYAGLGTQLLASIGIAVFIGLKLDRWLQVLPLFTCALPLLVLAVIFYKLIRQTGHKKTNDDPKSTS
jgi:F0F1-type ATP synthase assembly protein I